MYGATRTKRTRRSRDEDQDEDEETQPKKRLQPEFDREAKRDDHGDEEEDGEVSDGEETPAPVQLPPALDHIFDDKKPNLKEAVQIGETAHPAQVIQIIKDSNKQSCNLILGIQDETTLRDIRAREAYHYGAGNKSVCSAILPDPCTKESNPGVKYACVRIKLPLKDKNGQTNPEVKEGEQFAFMTEGKQWDIKGKRGVAFNVTDINKFPGTLAPSERLHRCRADLPWR